MHAKRAHDWVFGARKCEYPTNRACAHASRVSVTPFPLLTLSMDGNRKIRALQNPLSRITIASLQDLGYEVDYSTAESFGRANLGSGSCVCNRRTLLDMEHGETRQLGLGHPSTQPRRLGQATRQVALDYGRGILAERAAASSSSSSVSSSNGKPVNNSLVLDEYVGDQVVSVIVQDVGGYFIVVVRA